MEPGVVHLAPCRVPGLLLLFMDADQLKAKLEKAGLSTNASNWMLKALSPATPSGVGAMVPDQCAASLTNPEFVQSLTITNYGSANWDCLIVTPPSYPLVMFAIAAQAGFDFANTVWTPGTNCTIYSISTEPSSSAAVVANGATLGAFGSSSTTPFTYNTLEPSTQPIRWRRAYASLTAYLVASDLNNQGTITSGQYSARIATLCPGQILSTVGSQVYASQVLEIPLNEVNMTAMNPKVRVAPAKQGVYQPLYNAGCYAWAEPLGRPNMILGSGFGSGSPSVAVSEVYNQSGPGAFPAILCPYDPTGDLVQEGAFAGAALVQANALYTYGVDNTMTGVAIWRGLAQGASITVKTVVGLELQVAPTSPIRQFAVPSAPYEPEAMMLYYKLIHDMPHSFPASANFLSAILGAASRILPNILPGIAGFVTRGLAPWVAPERSEQPEMRVASHSTLPPPKTALDEVVAAQSRPRVRKQRAKARRVKVKTPRRAMSNSSRRSSRSRR